MPGISMKIELQFYHNTNYVQPNYTLNLTFTVDLHIECSLLNIFKCQKTIDNKIEISYTGILFTMMPVTRKRLL